MNRFWFRVLTILGFYSILAIQISSSGCAETYMYQPDEANQKIFTAFALKDQLCDTSHSITFPVFLPTHEEEVDLCIWSIFDTSCTKWEEDDPTPDLCLALLFDVSD